MAGKNTQHSISDDGPCWAPNRGYAPEIQPAPKLWLGPKFCRTLDTLWSIDSQKKISKFNATRF